MLGKGDELLPVDAYNQAAAKSKFCDKHIKILLNHPLKSIYIHTYLNYSKYLNSLQISIFNYELFNNLSNVSETNASQ